MVEYKRVWGEMNEVQRPQILVNPKTETDLNKKIN